MAQNDRFHIFLESVYEQITPEVVYSWIKADTNGRGILRRADYAFGFTKNDYPDFDMNQCDENEKGLLRILKDTIDEETGEKYSEKGSVRINKLINKVNQTCIAIKQILCKTLIADYDLLNEFQDYLFKQCLEDMFHKVAYSVTNPINEKDRLYRIRKNDPSEEFGVLDFYHIPFTKRYLMRTYRFSIPGYPSLYTSSSPYGAWEEMDRGEISEYGYITYKPKQEIRLLDLRWRFDDELKEDKEQLVLYLLRLPIIIACNMQLRHDSERFVPEYIFPQKIFKWLMDKLQEGVKMNNLSTKKYVTHPTWGVMYTSCKKMVWEALCRDYTNKGNRDYTPTIDIKDVTNYALLTHLPIKGKFSKYSMALGTQLYTKKPYRMSEPPSARECAYDSLLNVRKQLSRSKWYDLGAIIEREETAHNRN